MYKRQVLERVGLAILAKTPIEALSCGQFQRMLFARVRVQRAPLVMLDEPFTGCLLYTSDMFAVQRGDFLRTGENGEAFHQQRVANAVVIILSLIHISLRVLQIRLSECHFVTPATASVACNFSVHCAPG